MGANDIKLNLVPVMAKPVNDHIMAKPVNDHIKDYDVDGDGVAEAMPYTELGFQSKGTVDRLTKLQDSYDTNGRAMATNVTGGGGFWTGGHDSMFVHSPEGSTDQLGLVFEDYQVLQAAYSNGFQLKFNKDDGSLEVKTLRGNLSSADDSDGTSGYKTGEVLNKFKNGKEGKTIATIVDNKNGLDGKWSDGFTEKGILKDLIELMLEDTARQEDTYGWGGKVFVPRDDANHNPEVTQASENFFANYAKSLAEGGHTDKYIEFVGVMEETIGLGRTQEIITKDSGTESLVEFSGEVLRNDDFYPGNHKKNLDRLGKVAKTLSDAGAETGEIKKMIDGRLSQLKIGHTSDHEEARSQLKSALISNKNPKDAIETFLKEIGIVKPPVAKSSPASVVTGSPAKATAKTTTGTTPPTTLATATPPVATVDPAAFGLRIANKITAMEEKLSNPDTDSKFIADIDSAFSILNSEAPYSERSESINSFVDAFADDDGTNILKDALKGKTAEEKKLLLKGYANNVNDKYVQENGEYQTANFSEAKSPRELARSSKGLIDFTQANFINPSHIRRNNEQQKTVISDMERFMTGGQVEGEFEKHFNLDTANPPPFLASKANPDLVQGMWDSSKGGPGTFNMNAIFDGKTSIDDLAQGMVDYNNQYGLPADLVDKSEELTKVAPILTNEAFKPMAQKLGLDLQDQRDPRTGNIVGVDVPVVFRMQGGKVKDSSIRDEYKNFLEAVYPDKSASDVLTDKGLVDPSGSLNKESFMNTIVKDLSAMDQAGLVQAKVRLEKMGLGSMLSEKKFFKGYSKEEYKAGIMRYMQQLDSYRMHFQENINPLGNDLDSMVLSSFGDLYPEYKADEE